MRPVVSLHCISIIWLLFICRLLQIYFSTFFDQYCQHDQFQYQAYDQSQPAVSGESTDQISGQQQPATVIAYGICVDT